MEVLFGGGHPEKHNRVFELRPLTCDEWVGVVIFLADWVEQLGRLEGSATSGARLAPNPRDSVGGAYTDHDVPMKKQQPGEFRNRAITDVCLHQKRVPIEGGYYVVFS